MERKYLKPKCSCFEEYSYNSTSLKSPYIEQDVEENTCEITVDQFFQQSIGELRQYIYDGIELFHLCKILQDKFRVRKDCCCATIEYLKLQLDMYCPDKKHLYFIDKSNLDDRAKFSN